MEYPRKIDIIEIGPRDGFQNVKEFIPTDIKLRVIDQLLKAGVKEMQLTSFISPKAIPQMRDAAEIVSTVFGGEKQPERPIVLVPNYRGARDAFESGMRTASLVISASESHNKNNVNHTIDESFEELQRIRGDFPELKIRLDIAVAFCCPFEGVTPKEQVMSMIKRGLDAGVVEIELCDTIGTADPKQVYETCKEALKISAVPITVHIHDTRGMGLVNMLSAVHSGVTRFETAVGGLGGCPFAPGAAGNTATEDAVNMFEAMGISTGIDLGEYLKAVDIVREHINPNLTSRMGLAKIYDFDRLAPEAIRSQVRSCT